MENNTLSEISARLLAAERILLFPHMRADGDALGSAAALCAGLRQKGKQAYILIEDEIASNLRFLAGDFCTRDCGAAGLPDICVSVDCSAVDRFEKRKEVFFSARCKICLDHHMTGETFGDLNYIDPAASATGEIIFELLREMDVRLDENMAAAVYAAIETDTGGFRYSNTTKKSHLIVSELYKYGLDTSSICNEIYDSIRKEQLTLHAAALSEMELFAGGRADVACVSQNMLEETGAEMSETEGIVELLRSIRGVEISALLKEEGENAVKVSLRAKSSGNVAAVSQKFGGGGHRKAAGCTLRMPLAEARRVIMAAVEEELTEESM